MRDRERFSSARTAPGCIPGVELEKVRALRLPADAERLRAGRQPPSPDRSHETHVAVQPCRGGGGGSPPRAEDPWAAEAVCRVAWPSLRRRLASGRCVGDVRAGWRGAAAGRRSVTPRRAAAAATLPPCSMAICSAMSSAARPISFRPAPAASACVIAATNAPARQSFMRAATGGRSSGGMSPTVIGPDPA